MSRVTFDSSEYYEGKENFNGYCLGCGVKIGFTKALFLTKTGDLRHSDPPNRLMCCNANCVELFLKKTLKNWAELRRKAFRRDGYVCQDCGNGPAWPFYWETWKKEPKLKWYYPDGYENESWNNVKLEAHHIIAVKDGGPEFDLDNLITLCFDCHHLGRHGAKGAEEIERAKIISIRARHYTLDNFLIK